ncbi:MAG: YbhB/YbcL family Raf kinase inhibitor-like protein [Candidatus Colwellbacteria bacterium]|nr:YbhB/YbcL family Raf kinase inhibitor-like protein [Candidatus Colwellbacteria bacterium]
MKLESSVFEHEGAIPAKYTCDGENISPPMKISDVPQGTESLVLIMDDPDVPKSIRPDGVWDHWLVWNIPPETNEITEGQDLRAGKQGQWAVGKNTSSRLGYQGPCPPDREHRYFFKLYALDTVLDLSPETTTKSDLEAAMQSHILSQAELMGRYNRAESRS